MRINFNLTEHSIGGGDDDDDDDVKEKDDHDDSNSSRLAEAKVAIRILTLINYMGKLTNETTILYMD